MVATAPDNSNANPSPQLHNGADLKAIRRSLTWSLDLCHRQEKLIQSTLDMIDTAMDTKA
jgi:hypothetical protein